MSFRYGFEWYYDEVSYGGFDDDGNPIAATAVKTAFECDAQTDSGSITQDINGETLKSSYFCAMPLDSDLTFKKGDIVYDHNDQKRRVLNFFVSALSRELWVE